MKKTNRHYNTPDMEIVNTDTREIICQSGGAGYGGDVPENPPDKPFGTSSLDWDLVI